MKQNARDASLELKEAMALDARGQEAKAIMCYRRALKIGLKGEALHTALVGLGSSLRTVGDTAAAVRVLQRARRLFPNDVVVTLFLALAQWDAGQRALVVRQLGDAVLKESAQKRLAGYRQLLEKKYHGVRR